MTLNDLLPTIMTLCGQFGKSGTARNITVEDYKARIPMIADIGQRQLLDNVEKTFEYTKTTQTGTDKYIAVEMPDDFFSASDVIDTQSNGNYIHTPFYKFEGSKLYISNDYRGTLRIRYKPCPDPLTSLDDTLILDDNTAKTALVYYITAMLLLEENAEKANLYLQMYEEQRIKRKPASFEPIYDVYR